MGSGSKNLSPVAGCSAVGLPALFSCHAPHSALCVVHHCLVPGVPGPRLRAHIRVNYAWAGGQAKNCGSQCLCKTCAGACIHPPASACPPDDQPHAPAHSPDPALWLSPTLPSCAWRASSAHAAPALHRHLPLGAALLLAQRCPGRCPPLRHCLAAAVPHCRLLLELGPRWCPSASGRSPRHPAAVAAAVAAAAWAVATGADGWWTAAAAAATAGLPQEAAVQRCCCCCCCCPALPAVRARPQCA